MNAAFIKVLLEIQSKPVCRVDTIIPNFVQQKQVLLEHDLFGGCAVIYGINLFI